MSQRTQYDFDKLTLGLYLALVAVGWLMIFAVSYKAEEPYAFLSLGHIAGKQLGFMLFCFVMIFVVMLVDWAVWRTFALPIYFFTMILLPGTLLFGRTINGAKAWYHIGGVSFQPSELAKFGACLAMAAFLSSPGVDLRQWRDRVIAFMIFLIPALLVLLQRDTGSALVFFSFLLVLYREGLSPALYAIGFGTALMIILGLKFDPPYQLVAFLMMLASGLLIRRLKGKKRVWWWAFFLLLPLTFWWDKALALAASWQKIPLSLEGQKIAVMAPAAMLMAAAFFRNYRRKSSYIQGQLRTWAMLMGAAIGLVFAANAFFDLLAPHQQQRINIWLNPDTASAASRGAAYNLVHSKMAIGSGGFWGKGTLEGNMTKLKYVPEQSTDFIFCTVGEEQGFVGVLGLIGLFFWLLWRITILAERQRSNFSRVYAYCVAGIVFVHVVVNLGMTMGLLPIIGIPLPFISAGGSSLIGFSLMMAVLLKLDSNRHLA